ncbi:TetR/AcrR family transcriptional regulator [Amycolatopsis saalfeldensis]|uniref:DNA-binding transcriptional regulator, AcrR family n=1 Tax=Amycolatopsis saalfeldensis TaxID=394193 RepID=A0A1H8UIK9_9PSEU|nr:TetR family transcriptional regulator [Amycolatopsis saalfeldensis]SEP03062.1 DNA-binding transcriptional regulator, AcrR family [Amycolatopsis saalfeldensis]
MPPLPPLRERKRRRAQEAIVDAAFALFAERGFADVTVTEIAERAEVGRTTFFRYFGDKQEVLFAEERGMAEWLLGLRAEPAETPPTLREALDQARAAVHAMCEAVTADAKRYRLRMRLVSDSPELHDRGERKLLNLAEAMVSTLRTQGMPELEAALAAQLALGCFRAGRTVAGPEPRALAAAVEDAFALLLSTVPPG